MDAADSDAIDSEVTWMEAWWMICLIISDVEAQSKVTCERGACQVWIGCEFWKVPFTRFSGLCRSRAVKVTSESHRELAPRRLCPCVMLPRKSQSRIMNSCGEWRIQGPCCSNARRVTHLALNHELGVFKHSHEYVLP